MLALSELMGKSSRWLFLALALFSALETYSQGSLDLYNQSLQRALVRPEAEESVRISEEFYRGRNLIYDCRKRHYACVSSSGYQKCRDWREQSFQNRDSLFSCAPLKSYTNSQQCQQNLYLLVHRAASKAFCINHHLRPLQKSFK